MDTFYNDTTFVFGNMQFLLCFPSSLQYLLVCKILLIFFIISFHQLIEDLSFFQTTMADCSQYRIPVTESIFTHNGFQELRFCIDSKFISFGLGILCQHVFAFQDVIFFQFFLEPLIDLILCLCALDKIQPVTARSL